MSDWEIPDLNTQANDFARYGEEVVQWIAEYLRAPEKYPVLSRCQPGEIKAQLPPHPPAAPETMDAILADFSSILMPGMTHWNHPGFMAYFANSSPAPGVIAEALAAALNQNAMLWRTSPAATELEEVVLGWLAQMLGMPEGRRGLITDTASISSLLAICAAREAIPGLDIRTKGLSGRTDVPRLRLYCSEQAHSSIERAAMTLGIGQEGVRKIPTDSHFRMDVGALRQALLEDTKREPKQELNKDKDPKGGEEARAEWLPFCVVATVGTTSTTAVDPVPEIAALCREYGLWLHVDAAYGGAVALVPEYRHLMAGCEEADTIVINPHKWLFTPMDCSVLFARDMNALRRAFSLVPDYLMTEGDVTNFMDYGVQLGRRFRALKLWMIIRAFGTEAMGALIREHIRLAQIFAEWIDASPDFERLAPVPMSAVCFRARPHDMEDKAANQAANHTTDEATDKTSSGKSAETSLDAITEARSETLNTRLMEAVNATGEIFISHTKLNGRYTLRLAIGNMHTREKHVARAWQLLNDCLAAINGTA